ncbi:MAG: hypothetical protein Q7S36_01230 [Candidatus Liptonbacteria bacterium]|nr:hypothetical protein [Candidatus Liptonbacteria bacterium]
MHIRISTKIGFITRLFGLAWGLNFLWELAQMPLYIVGTFPAFPLGWIRASLWDASYTAIVYLFFGFLHQDFYWIRRKNIWDLFLIIIIGFVTATIVETQALALGKWFYTSTMPLVPVLKVGLTPFIQLPLLSFAVYWIMRKKFSRYYS